MVEKQRPHPFGRPISGWGLRSLSHHVSRTKITSNLTRYSIILEFSTATRDSTIFIPVMPLKVFVARANPILTASSKLFGEPAIISVTLATLGSAIRITSLLLKIVFLLVVYTESRGYVNEKKMVPKGPVSHLPGFMRNPEQATSQWPKNSHRSILY